MRHGGVEGCNRAQNSSQDIQGAVEDQPLCTPLEERTGIWSRMWESGSSLFAWVELSVHRWLWGADRMGEGDSREPALPTSPDHLPVREWGACRSSRGPASYNWYLYAGDPSDPQQEAELLARSPLSRVDQIRTPLVVAQGANDIRVVHAESDRIVDALRARGVEVEYMGQGERGRRFCESGQQHRHV